ncbi:hypothetical protein J1614_011491 [Plenodomus biglobosus]|nr:hypothetical protein J1614_011491 [Plenodomus biglobosus]
MPNMHSSPPFSLEETEELDVHSAARQNRIMENWLFTSAPKERSISTISSLHQITLVCGLATLYQRINDLAGLEIKLHSKYLNLLTAGELSVQAIMYAGCSWYASLDEMWEQLDRAELERLLKRDVTIYDRIAKKVEEWKTEIERKIQQR